MLKRLPLLATLGLSLVGCVAPEEPETPRPAPPVAARPTAPDARFEDAPVPNRRLGPNSDDSVIRLAPIAPR